MPAGRMPARLPSLSVVVVVSTLLLAEATLHCPRDSASFGPKQGGPPLVLSGPEGIAVEHFATPIAVGSFAGIDGDLEAIKLVLSRLRESGDPGVQRGGGWQSSDLLSASNVERIINIARQSQRGHESFARGAPGALARFFDAAMAAARPFGGSGTDDDDGTGSNDVFVQKAWLTVTRHGEELQPHTHPHAVVSGVLYLDDGGGSGRVEGRTSAKMQVVDDSSSLPLIAEDLEELGQSYDRNDGTLIFFDPRPSVQCASARRRQELRLVCDNHHYHGHGDDNGDLDDEDDAAVSTNDSNEGKQQQPPPPPRQRLLQRQPLQDWPAPRPLELGDSGHTKWAAPAVGRLLIWPSWLPHRVALRSRRRGRDGRPRLSIAFNMWLGEPSTHAFEQRGRQKMIEALQTLTRASLPIIDVSLPRPLPLPPPPSISFHWQSALAWFSAKDRAGLGTDLLQELLPQVSGGLTYDEDSSEGARVRVRQMRRDPFHTNGPPSEALRRVERRLLTEASYLLAARSADQPNATDYDGSSRDFLRPFIGPFRLALAGRVVSLANLGLYLPPAGKEARSHPVVANSFFFMNSSTASMTSVGQPRNAYRPVTGGIFCFSASSAASTYGRRGKSGKSGPTTAERLVFDITDPRPSTELGAPLLNGSSRVRWEPQPGGSFAYEAFLAEHLHISWVREPSSISKSELDAASSSLESQGVGAKSSDASPRRNRRRRRAASQQRRQKKPTFAIFTTFYPDE